MLISSFSGLPRTASAPSPQQSAGSDSLQQSLFSSSQQSLSSSVSEEFVSACEEDDEDELSSVVAELLKAPQPVSSDTAASIDIILALLFMIFFTFQI